MCELGGPATATLERHCTRVLFKVNSFSATSGSGGLICYFKWAIVAISLVYQCGTSAALSTYRSCPLSNQLLLSSIISKHIYVPHLFCFSRSCTEFWSIKVSSTIFRSINYLQFRTVYFMLFYFLFCIQTVRSPCLVYLRMHTDMLYYNCTPQQQFFCNVK